MITVNFLEAKAQNLRQGIYYIIIMKPIMKLRQGIYYIIIMKPIMKLRQGIYYIIIMKHIRKLRQGIYYIIIMKHIFESPVVSRLGLISFVDVKNIILFSFFIFSFFSNLSNQNLHKC